MRFPRDSRLQVDFPQIRDFTDPHEIRRTLVWMREITEFVNRLLKASYVVPKPPDDEPPIQPPGPLPLGDFIHDYFLGSDTDGTKKNFNLSKKAASKSPIFAFRNGLASIPKVHYTVFYAATYTQIRLLKALRTTDNLLVYYKESGS